jgi:hypothetical protein
VGRFASKFAEATKAASFKEGLDALLEAGRNKLIKITVENRPRIADFNVGAQIFDA